MKKIISLALALVLAFGALQLTCFTSFMADESCLVFEEHGEDGYWVVDCDESAAGLLYIPATYNGKAVTGIGVNAFYNCNSITQINIPNCVTSINDSFYCKSLAWIGIAPNTYYSSKGGGALLNYEETVLFRYPIAKNAPSYAVPSSVVEIKDGAFYECGYLESITVPNSVTSIGEKAFSFCEKLKSITLSDKLTVIKTGTFSGCRSLESIVIPNGVTTIEPDAFGFCESLVSITIPKSVTSIETAAFSLDDMGIINVYYAGSKAEWEKINFGEHNEEILTAMVHFEGETDFLQRIINFFQEIVYFFRNLFGIR